jgi:single-stranded-DNA-specific exonuclease
MNLKWVIQDDLDKDVIESFSKLLKVPKIISQILLNRGIDTFEKAKLFFRGKLEDLYDPFLLPDMGKAVDRIIKAINGKEKILIYGDYDVDGITAVSMLYLLLQQLGADVIFYIPNRIKEGYGITILGIDEAFKKQIRLIISVDCGITAIKEIEHAQRLGMDVIISDHHEPGLELPKAFAVLNPKCQDSNYPFQELAGVGVAYKLVQALISVLKLDHDIINNYVKNIWDAYLLSAS